MRNITINLPDTFVRVLDKFAIEKGTNRSELIRQAIRDLLKTDIPFQQTIDTLCPQGALERKRKQAIKEKEMRRQNALLKLGLKKQKILEFYNYCVICERRLHKSRKPRLYNKKINVYEMRFCCDCYEKQKTLNQLPRLLEAKIKEKLEEYHELKEELKDKEDFKDIL